MNISSIEVFVLKTPLDEPFAFSQGWVTQRVATLVRIRTEQGIDGWGEAFTQGLEAPEIAASVINHAFKPMLLGGSALDTAVHWHSMYHKSRDFGRKGSVIAAMSAIDTALWDIVGKMPTNLFINYSVARFAPVWPPMPQAFTDWKDKVKHNDWLRKLVSMSTQVFNQ